MINPVTKERFVWRHTATSTEGAFAEFDLFLGVGAVVAAPHVHPLQQEDFRVEQGEIGLRAGGIEERLTAGAERTVSPGTPHAWWQTGQGEAHVIVRLTPSLRSEDCFETFCGLARDGKVNTKGLPGNPLQLAVLAHEYRSEFALTSAAARFIARPVVAGLAPIGRLSGLRRRYPAYSTD
jgi:mannose-6-phosphate isomerase-like protein (cupin superfamily)